MSYMPSSIGQYNGTLGNVYIPQYQARPQSFRGTQQTQIVEEPKKKSKAVKTAVGIGVGVGIALATLYGLVKTGKLTKVDNAQKWTEKLQNLAFKAGDSIGKGADAVVNYGKNLLGKTKDIPNLNINVTDEILTADGLKEIMSAVQQGAKSGVCSNGAKWTLG